MRCLMVLPAHRFNDYFPPPVFPEPEQELVAATVPVALRLQSPAVVRTIFENVVPDRLRMFATTDGASGSVVGLRLVFEPDSKTPSLLSSPLRSFARRHRLRSRLRSTFPAFHLRTRLR